YQTAPQQFGASWLGWLLPGRYSFVLTCFRGRMHHCPVCRMKMLGLFWPGKSRFEMLIFFATHGCALHRHRGHKRSSQGGLAPAQPSIARNAAAVMGGGLRLRLTHPKTRIWAASSRA